MQTVPGYLKRQKTPTSSPPRFDAWMRKDELACLEQQAVDDQYRFLAGLRPAPADLPTEGELAKAAALYADELTVRDVAKKMGISVGKAHCLKMKAAAFKVQPNVNMNTAPETSLGAVAPYSSNEDGKIEEPQRPPADDLPFPEMPVHLRRPLPVAHRKPR